jgi:cell division protein FtsN
LEEVPDDQPPAGHARYRLGTVLQRQGQWRNADAHFNRVMHYFGDTEIGKLAARRTHSNAWTIQAGAFERSSGARAAAQRLQAAGLSATTRTRLVDSRPMTIIQVGRYDRFYDAETALPSVRRVEPHAFIVTTR